MKRIFFAIIVFGFIAMQAQTVYHYNMPCGQERYFKTDSTLLALRILDSAITVSLYNTDGVETARYAGDFLGKNTSTLKRDDEMAIAEISFPEKGKIQFIQTDAKGQNRQLITYSEVSSKEMIPFDYHCFTAYRAIYYDSEQGKDSVRLFIQRRYPVPARGISSEDSIAFIQAVLATHQGLPNDFQYPEDIIKNADIMMVQDYTSMYETGEMEPDFTANWEINDDIDIVLNENGLLGWVNSSYEYTGGAHGLYVSSCNVYDFTTQNIVSFDEMFIGNYEPVLITIINETVKSQFNLGEGESLSSQGFFVDTIPLTENFVLYPDHILFVYNVYEIAPYAVGSIDVEIPFPDIDEFIKKDGPIYKLIN